MTNAKRASAIFEGGAIALTLAQEIALQAEDHEGWEVQTVGVEIGDDSVIARLGLARGLVAVLVTTWVDGAGVEASHRYSGANAPAVARALDSPTATEVWDAIHAAEAQLTGRGK